MRGEGPPGIFYGGGIPRVPLERIEELGIRYQQEEVTGGNFFSFPEHAQQAIVSFAASCAAVDIILPKTPQS